MAITENLKIEFDEVIQFGVVKMSSATYKTLQEETEQHETGHNAGHVKFITRQRADLNDKFADEAAQKRYREEFGHDNAGAYDYYKAKDAAAFAQEPEEHHDGE